MRNFVDYYRYSSIFVDIYRFLSTKRLLKYVLIKLRRYLFDCIHINCSRIFSSVKIYKRSIINWWKVTAKQAIDYSSISNISRLINNDWYWLISILIAVHFLRILQWWGKTAKGPIFLALPPAYSMRSPKLWVEYRRHELARGVKAGGMPQKIF
jgi:hypothetical protein